MTGLKKSFLFATLVSVLSVPSMAFAQQFEYRVPVKDLAVTTMGAPGSPSPESPVEPTPSPESPVEPTPALRPLITLSAHNGGVFPSTLTGSTRSLVVTVINEGNAPATLAETPVRLTTGAPFSITASNCVNQLAEGASCSVTVRFAPTTGAGTFTSALQVHFEAEGSPRSIPLQGSSHFDGLLMSFDGSYTDTVGGRTASAYGGSGMTFDSIEKAFGSHSLRFNGSGYLCMAPFSFLEPGTNNFTVEFWLMPTTDKGAAVFVRHQAGVSLMFYLWRTAAGALSLNETPSSTLRGSTPAGATPKNVWTHVALVRNNGVTKIYINGQAKMSTTTSTANQYNGSGTMRIAIGGGACNTVHSPFSGRIDELRISRGAKYTGDFATPTRAPD